MLMKPHERIIVALDVPTNKEALAIVKELNNVVSFYKVGLELLMSGGMQELLRALVHDNHSVFVDLKLPSDIPETVSRVVGLAADIGVKFMTLSNSATPGTIVAALSGRAGRVHSPDPKLLYVSFLSSLDRTDFALQYGRPESDFEPFLEERTKMAKEAGAEGFIVSGKEIALLRKRYPRGQALIVSPGIRPAGAPKDDHKRACTPAEAIQLGADYIVVGRPIRNAPDKREAAQRIIDEIAEVETGGGSSFNGHTLGTSGYGSGTPIVAKPR
jgi:orotidine-5'-phosphate decarboxylase